MSLSDTPSIFPKSTFVRKVNKYELRDGDSSQEVENEGFFGVILCSQQFLVFNLYLVVLHYDTSYRNYNFPKISFQLTKNRTQN